jgi:hypothetical protein
MHYLTHPIIIKWSKDSIISRFDKNGKEIKSRISYAKNKGFAVPD